MKKILCFMMFVLLLVSCSKDSGEEGELANNYIEVNGERYKIDSFVYDWYFAIGSGKDDAYINLVYDSDHEPVFDKKMYIEDDLVNIRRVSVCNNSEYCNIDKWYRESYYYVEKKGSDNYHVDVLIKAKNFKLIVNYDGKMLK